MSIDIPRQLKKTTTSLCTLTFTGKPLSSWIRLYGATSAVHILFQDCNDESRICQQCRHKREYLDLRTFVPTFLNTLNDITPFFQSRGNEEPTLNKHASFQAPLLKCAELTFAGCVGYLPVFEWMNDSLLLSPLTLCWCWHSSLQFSVMSYISSNQATSNWQLSNRNRKIGFGCSVACNLPHETSIIIFEFWIACSLFILLIRNH